MSNPLLNAEKACCKCDVVMPLSDFHRNRKTTDGYQNACKSCRRIYAIAYHLANPLRRREIERRYRASAAGKQTKRRARLAYALRWPERRSAHHAVSNAIQAGRMNVQACEVCGSAHAEAHHDDYSKPLAVRWLCARHHLEHHATLLGLQT